MIGSPLRRAAAFAAALTLLLLGLERWALRDLRADELARFDASLEQTARALVEELAGAPLAEASPERLSELARRAAAVAGVRVTAIDAEGVVRADSDVKDTHLAAIENHGDREEVRAAAASAAGVGSATRTSDTVVRELRYVAVRAPGGGVVRVSRGLEGVEARLADARGHGLALIAWAALIVVAGVPLFSWLFHRRPLREVRRMAEEVAEGRLDARAPRTRDPELARIAASVQRTAAQLRSRLRAGMQEEQQLRAVLEAMVEGVLVVDARGQILLANSRLRDLFDVHGEITGRPLLEGVRNADLDAILAEAASTKEPVARSVELSDGRTLQVMAAPFPGDGERVGTVAVCHDTTELMRLEEVRRDFVANASHELRTPLAAIRGFAETLVDGETLSAEDRKSYLEVIHRHALRLSNLVEDLLELSTIESRTAKLELGPVDVSAVARNWIDDSQLRLEERRLEVTTRVEGSPLAFADARALDQILGNLLDNAMKYSEPGGQISVSIAQRGERVRVAVSDTGIGIPPEDRGRIFERFYRVDRARSRALGGTGLGLAIVKHLVQAQGGDIGVHSEVGRGSTFTFGLPSADPGHAPEVVEVPTALGRDPREG